MGSASCLDRIDSVLSRIFSLRPPTKPDVFGIRAINRFSDKELGQGRLGAKEKSRTPSLAKQEKDSGPDSVVCRGLAPFAIVTKYPVFLIQPRTTRVIRDPAHPSGIMIDDAIIAAHLPYRKHWAPIFSGYGRVGH
jgi:hypothetical protein